MDRAKVGRLLAFFLLGVLCISLLLALLHQGVLPLLAWFVPFLETPFYDFAVYGAYPTQKYQSFDLQSPAASLLRWDESCDNGLIMLSPNGKSVESPGPMILDAQGSLIWMTTEYGTSFNLRVQRYHDQDYLTFWSGEKSGSMGVGAYHMLDSNYKLFKTVAAVGENNHGDLHEFIITDEGTALMTVYNKTQADLSAMGRPKDGWITDSLFQEIDIETGELIFQWRASDHFEPTDSYYKNPLGGYWEADPYDFFHINSLQKDSHGNYLISARHLHIIACISPEGEILWELGGRHSDFEDLSDGQATDFTWQHDARWVDEEKGILSVFDNGGAGPIMVDADYSKGLVIQLDLEKRTAKLLHSYVSQDQLLSASQGSVQMLPNSDHVFVGWGSSGAYSEYTPDGTLLCETHIGASLLFWWERVKSYRALKTATWIGEPYYPPSAKVSGNTLFVSWNGATEVVAWQLEGLPAGQDGAAADAFEKVDIITKDAFECSFILPSAGTYRSYRVAALDADAAVLRYSSVVEEEQGGAVSAFFLVLFGVCACTGLGAGVWLFVTKVLRKRKTALFSSWEMPAYRYQKL